MRIVSFVLCLLCCCFGGQAQEIEETHYQYSGKAFQIEHTEVINDASNSSDIFQAISMPSDKWQIVDLKKQALGLSHNRVWVRLRIENVTTEQANLLFGVNNALLDDVIISVVGDDEVLSTIELGDNRIFSVRPINSPLFWAPLELAPGQSVQLYLSVQSAGPLILPMLTANYEQFTDLTAKQNLSRGAIFGFLIAIALVNFAIAAATRTSYYCWYAMNVVMVVSVIFSLNGLNFQYLWPHNPWLQQHAVSIFSSLSFAFYVLFSKEILQFEDSNITIIRTNNTLLYSAFISTIASFVLPVGASLSFMLVVVCSGLALLSYTGIKLSREQFSARIYTISTALLCAATIYSSVIGLGLISSTLSFSTIITYGMVSNTIMLSVLVAIRFAEESRDRQLAQKDMLEAALQIQAAQSENLRIQEEAQAETIKLQRDTQEELESRVSERTFELEITLRELEEKNNELEELSSRDPLTHIRNRRYFDDRLQREYRRHKRDKMPLSIVMLDIDHFKKVNDEHGHIVGDEAIKFIAVLIQQQLKRPADTLSRYGGEEFALILPSTPKEGAKQLAESIVIALKNTPMPSKVVTLAMTVSAGISTADDTNDVDARQLLDQADKALYQAKDNGRNQAVVFKQND